MYIETPRKPISKSDKEVYEFLSDLSNFENLMPDSIEKFQVLDEDTFVFALKGMPEVVLKKKEEHPYSQVILGAASDKLPFTLTANIVEAGQEKSEVSLHFEGEFNAMMAMMIKAPITNFIGTLSEKLSAYW